VALQRAGCVVELGGSEKTWLVSGISELFEQPVNDTCRPSFVWKLCPQLSRIISLQLI